MACTTLTGSDVATAAFAEDFAARLLIYHAMSFGNLKKESFEHAFIGACRAAGRTAEQPHGRTHAGEDVLVDGTPFSLKTEASKAISVKNITISKLMEMAGIKAMTTQVEWATVGPRVVTHLMSYSRILILRAFNLNGGRVVSYQLVEIPHSLLARVGNLPFSAYVQSPRARWGVTAHVYGDDGELAFDLVLDRNDEKITIKNLDVRKCLLHATWNVAA